jgi:hypothetical protein
MIFSAASCWLTANMAAFSFLDRTMREQMKRFIVILSFLLLLFGLQSTLVSAAAITQRIGSTSPITFVASKCWLQGGNPHDSCNRPWWACLAEVKRVHGNFAPSLNAKCDQARRQCEARLCK